MYKNMYLCIGALQCDRNFVCICVCVCVCVCLFISTLAPLFLLPINNDWTVVMGPIQCFHTSPLLQALSTPVPL